MKLGSYKKDLNRIIMLRLKEIGLPYRDMRQATLEVAESLGLAIKDPCSIAGRALVVQKINGEDPADGIRRGRQMRKAEVAERHAKRAAKRAERKALLPTSLPGIPSASTLERDIKAFYASWEWKRLSYDVKLERGRKCECCGARAPDVRIQTDHVKPVRYYWHLRFERANLQVLCEDCNMGKGSRDETDFRTEDRAPTDGTVIWN